MSYRMQSKEQMSKKAGGAPRGEGGHCWVPAPCIQILEGCQGAHNPVLKEHHSRNPSVPEKQTGISSWQNLSHLRTHKPDAERAPMEASD